MWDVWKLHHKNDHQVVLDVSVLKYASLKHLRKSHDSSQFILVCDSFKKQMFSLNTKCI